MSKKYINTLDFYGFRENNKMEPVLSNGYKVKVSDKDGNIITIEKDDSLYACVKLAFDNDTGVLSLLDAAHDDAVLAEIEMPNADYIYNCRFDENLNAILFDVKSLYGNNTDTIELDVESLVELYEAGQGIEIGEKNEETGRKPISIKLVEGEELLTLTDEGLGLDGKVITEDELAAAISGKADIEYVDELFAELSGVTSGISGIVETLEEHGEEIEKLKRIVGTDEEIPSLYEQIEDNREDIAELDDEIGEINSIVGTISGAVETIEENVNNISGDVESLKDALDEEIARATSAETELQGEIDAEAGRAISAETVLNEKLDEEIEARKTGSVASADYDSNEKLIKFYNANDEVVDSIDATAFIKDGMVDSVELVEMSGDTYLHIVFNTDAGKEDIYINIGDIFNADNYYTKGEIDEKVTALQEMDAALVNVDTQQWAVINQNRQDMETVDAQLWAAIENETNIRRNADLDLWNALSDESNARIAKDNELQTQIDTEKEQRENDVTRLTNALSAETQARIDGDNRIEAYVDNKITAEKNRAILAETEIAANLAAETQRATREEARIVEQHNEDVEELRQADRTLRQYVNDKDADINRRIDGVIEDLANEAELRISGDTKLEESINDIRNRYATIEYVNTQDEYFKEAAIQTSTGFAKSYTDTEIDNLEVTLKQYCDSGHTELQNNISDNATKINVISNLLGVSGDDASNYDDSGNGILDVLHREFHEFEKTGGSIKDIKVVGGNLLITYYTKDGEKTTIIPVEDFVDLSNYYNKQETDALLNEKASIDDVENIVSGKTDLSLFNELVAKLGYTDNNTLVKTSPLEVAFGEYNISNTSDDPSGQTAFSIGIGTDDENRKNAIEIRKDGSIYMWVEGEFMAINHLIGMLAHETY